MDRLLKVLRSEVGYMEKKNSDNLDSKTGNAGQGNYTKYSRDIDECGLMGCQGQYWCATFVTWCFMQAYGVDKGLGLLHMSRTSYCGYSVFHIRDRFSEKQRAQEPHVGDLVIFNYSHIGVVVSVKDSHHFKSVEGNTCVGDNRNGGMVMERDRNTDRVQCFLRPRYAGDIILTKPSQNIAPAKNYNHDLAGKYDVMLYCNVRKDAGFTSHIIRCIKRGETVKNYGYYTLCNGIKWLVTVDSYGHVGYISENVLRKVKK